MRKNLKKLKDLDNLLESEANEDQEDKKKKKRRKKEVVRQPNVLGGGLVLASLLILFFAIQYFPDKTTASDTAKNATTIAQHESANARKRVSSELEGYADGVQEKIDNFSVLGVTLESKQAEKLEKDVSALQDVPQKAVETAKNEVLTTTIGEVVDSVLRLRKIGEDIENLKNIALEKLENF